MGWLFNSNDDYSDVYDDFSFDPSDPDIDDSEDEIERLRGNIKSGDCVYCGARNKMKYFGNCFICTKCKMAIDEELYYRWAAGYDIDVDDDDYYEDDE